MEGKIFLAAKDIPKIEECHTINFLPLYVQTKWYGTVLSGVLILHLSSKLTIEIEIRKVSCIDKSALGVHLQASCETLPPMKGT